MLLHGVRLDVEVREIVVGAVELGGCCRHAGAQCGEGLVGACTAVGERRPEEGEFLFEGSDSQSEDEPAATDGVESAVAFRDFQGVVVAEDEDARVQTDARRACGEIPEGRQRVPVDTAAFGRDVCRDGDVFAAGQMVVAEFVGGLRDSREFRDPGVALPLRLRGGVSDNDG